MRADAAVPEPTAPMAFSIRLARLRREAGLTQQALADLTGIHVTQLRRYEAGRSEPALDTLRRPARALGATSDALVFAADDRGPRDERLRRRLEAIDELDDDEIEVLLHVADAILVKHATRRWLRGSD